MPEQLPPSNHTHARTARLALAASLCFGVAAASANAAPAAFAQGDAPQPRAKAAPATTATTAAQGTKAGEAKVKARGAQASKPASATASKATRSRRAAEPPTGARPTAAPAASSGTPTNADVTPVPPVTAGATNGVAPVEKPAASSAPEKGLGGSKSKGEEAELERLRAEIKDTKAGAERVRLQRALVERLVELKREAEALDALRMMIHEDRYDPPFFFNTGNALARLGDASAAEDAYRKAILQRRGNYARALNNLGVILIRQGHWEEAQQTFAAALLQENYAYPEASYNLGRLYLLRGEADLAISEWTRTLRLEPTHAEAAAALARTYAEDGDARRGLAVLDNFVARSTRGGTGIPPEIAEARREIVAAAGERDEDKTRAGDGAGGGNSRLAAGHPSGGAGRSASGGRLRAIEVDRTTYDLLRAARARREQGSYEESVKGYRNVLAHSPAGYFPPANLELGAALINLKRDAEAIVALRPLTEKDGARFPVAYYHLGRLYERQGELARAAEHFARAAELYGDTNPQVLVDLSRAREKTGDTAGALTAMNAYAASIARQGTVPEWVAERQAKLKQKISASQPAQSSTAKP